MRRMMPIGLAILVLCLGPAGAAEALIVDVDALQNHAGNPVLILLPTGAYDVVPIGIGEAGAFNAWNAWVGGDVMDCNSVGEKCTRGWINEYSLASSELGAITITDGGRYATPLDSP